MEGNSGRASFNKSYVYAPMRKPHSHNAREDPSTPTTMRTPSVLSPDAPVFVPKQKCSSNQPAKTDYSNHDGSSEVLTRDFSNMNMAPKNPSGWCTVVPPGQNHSNQSMSVQGRMNVSSSSVQSRLNVSSLHNHSGPVHDRLNQSSGQHDRSHMSSNVQNRLNVSGRRELNFSNYECGDNGDINQENPDQSEDEKFALDYIAHIVTYLNQNPGSFDTISTRALSVFEGFSDNEFVLSNSMEIIFNKSIEEQNFRYMGARLYALLDSIDGSIFRSLLDFKLTYHRDEILRYMQNEHFKVRGTALFLAELFMQLRNDGVRIPQIAQNIVYCMNQLLRKTTPENIKCICLTLKLAAFDLEANYPLEIAEIIKQLRKLKDLDVSTGRVLDNVLNLQKNNWGRSEVPVQSTLLNESLERISDAPVFYGPDGQVLTEEENNFLESNLPQDEINVEDDNDSDEFDFDPGMDSEMEKAYNDFLKSSPNNLC